MENKKRKKDPKKRPIGEEDARRAKDRFLSSHHLPRKRSEGPSPLGEEGIRRAENRFLSTHDLPREKSPKDRTPLEKGVPEGRRIDLSHPIIFPISNTIEGLPITTYKKAPATRIGASGISICIAFR